jgi:hypothetical protein
MSTRRTPNSGFWDRVVVKWGGTVQVREASPERAVYEFGTPSADVTYRFANDVQGQLLSSRDNERRASEYNCHYPGQGPNCQSVTVTVESTKDHSSVVVNAGNPARFLIALKGAPGLFPSPKLPDSLPPASAYTEAWVGYGDGRDREPVDQLGPCSP